MPFVDLELGLHGTDPKRCAIEMRLVTSDDQGDRRLDEATPLDLGDGLVQELLSLSLDPTKYGERLTRALFALKETCSFYRDALKKAHDLNTPLRFALTIPRTLRSLDRLRWEMLRDPDDLAGGPLSMRGDVHFFRYLRARDWRPIRPHPRGHRLSSLVVIANGSNLDKQAPHHRARPLAAVPVADELKRAREGLKDTELTELVTPGQASLSNLVAELRKGHDILYLVCHGAVFASETILYLEDETGAVARVRDAEFVAVIRGLVTQPRLVVLASCESAGKDDPASSEDDGAFLGLGPLLVEAGIPAVLAMHGKIFMRTVEEFMPTLFAALFAPDGSVEAAVSVARFRVRARSDAHVPVLFSRLRAGKLWELPADQDKFPKWDSLIGNIRRGRCTPILGYGVLEPFIGSTRDIAARWAEDYGFPLALEEGDDLPRVAQYIALQKDESFLLDLLERQFQRELRRRFRDLPAAGTTSELLASAAEERRARGDVDVHAILAALSCKTFITATPDDLLANTLQQAKKAPQVVASDWTTRSWQAEQPAAKVDSPLVFQIFGHLDQDAPHLQTEDDYFNFLLTFGAPEERSKRVPHEVCNALTNTGLLFLGFHIGDWSFRTLLHAIRRFEGRQRNRYTNVAVQIDPEADRIVEPEHARRYLEKYLGHADITIFWGTTEAFLRELGERWRKAAT